MNGKKHSEESKRKISESKKGKPRVTETKMKISKAQSRPIIQYSKTGKFIQTWYGIREAGRQLNICPPNISLCCRRKVKSAGGFIWRFAKK